MTTSKKDWELANVESGVLIQGQHELVQTGIYSVVRNPIYSGTMLWWPGARSTPGISLPGGNAAYLVLVDQDFSNCFRITMPERKAESVLELPAHTIFRSRTQVGDQLLIGRYEARKPVKSGMAGPIGLEEHGTDGHGGDGLPAVLPGEVQPVAPHAPVVPIAPQSSGIEVKRSSVAATKTRV